MVKVIKKGLKVATQDRVYGTIAGVAQVASGNNSHCNC